MTNLSAQVVAFFTLLSIATAGDNEISHLSNRQVICEVGYYNCNNVCLPNNAVCAVAPVYTVVPPAATVTAVIPGWVFVLYVKLRY